MFFQLLYIHLFRPFLKYNQATSPLPTHVSPRKLCTQAAATISKLLRLYKRSHGLRQICNVVVYIAHSACTIHLLSLSEKNARRDIIHGVKHLEEIAESWLCARRTLGILSVLAKKWSVDLPEEATVVLARTNAKFGPYNEVGTPKAAHHKPPIAVPEQTTTTMASPLLPVYSMPALPNTTDFFQTSSLTTTSSHTSAALRRSPENRCLPPSAAADLAYPRTQRHASGATQAPTSPAGSTTQRQSVDSSSATSTYDSPSQLFGGVDALIREGQDWWLRDQSQLALGFDNWNITEADVAWLNSTTAAGGGSLGSGFVGAGAGVAGNGNGVGGVGMNGVNGYGGAMCAYNEEEWYQ